MANLIEKDGKKIASKVVGKSSRDTMASAKSTTSHKRNGRTQRGVGESENREEITSVTIEGFTFVGKSNFDLMIKNLADDARRQSGNVDKNNSVDILGLDQGRSFEEKVFHQTIYIDGESNLDKLVSELEEKAKGDGQHEPDVEFPQGIGGSFSPNSLHVSESPTNVLKNAIERLKNEPSSEEIILKTVYDSIGRILDAYELNAGERVQSNPKYEKLIKKSKQASEISSHLLSEILDLIGQNAESLQVMKTLLNNPPLIALLSPPTDLELEVKMMVSGELCPVAKYPEGRAKGKPNPCEFVSDVYFSYVNARCLYLDQLRKIDPVLVKALENRAFNQSEDIPVLRDRERVNKYIKDIPFYLIERIAMLGNALTRRLSRNPLHQK